MIHSRIPTNSCSFAPPLPRLLLRRGSGQLLFACLPWTTSLPLLENSMATIIRLHVPTAVACMPSEQYFIVYFAFQFCVIFTRSLYSREPCYKARSGRAQAHIPRFLWPYCNVSFRQLSLAERFRYPRLVTLAIYPPPVGV